MEKEQNNTKILSVDERIPEADDVIALIDERRFAEFRSVIEELPEADIAELFEMLPEKYLTTSYRLLSKKLAAGVFVEMDPDGKEYLINSFTDSELSATLDELYLDDTVDIIEEMPAAVVKRIIRASSSENRNIINRLLKYPKNSAGTIMTTEYMRFTEEMTVDEALRHIRRVALDKETIYTCYVTDKSRHLVGIVTAKELLISALDTKLGDIMEESVIFVNTTDDREEVAHKLGKYDFLALPVVDAESRLVGIITVDDAIDVIKEEAEEDFAKMAAVTPDDTPYIKTSVLSLVRSRIPWLLLLMLSATFSSAILSGFESVLPAVLIIFVPMLMGTGGNSGGQSSVTVIRAISVGELEFKQMFKVLWKETLVGLVCGISLGAVCFAKVMLIDGLLMQNTSVTLTVALIVSAALAITILTAKIIGSTLPLLAKKIGFDPAVMASPLITTLVDVVSLVIYFLIARTII